MKIYGLILFAFERDIDILKKALVMYKDCNNAVPSGNSDVATVVDNFLSDITSQVKKQK